METRRTERERLIELLNKAPKSLRYEDLPDYLLENGVIVPPCKVGDKVYMLDTIVDYDKCENCEFYYESGMGDYPDCNKGYCGNRPNECVEIKEVIVTQKDLYWWLYMDDIGIAVFPTREEAEKVLHKINHNSLCETETYKIKQFNRTYEKLRKQKKNRDIFRYN